MMLANKIKIQGRPKAGGGYVCGVHKGFSRCLPRWFLIPPAPRHPRPHPARPSLPGPARNAPGYLVRQRGALHFRMRVPDALRPCLGCTELRRRLGTASLREADPVIPA